MPRQSVVLTDRVAVITGGTRGIGRSIAELFGRVGAYVVVSSSRAEAVAQAVTDLTRQGIRCSGFVCDVSVRADVEALLQQTLDAWGHIDIWVNNAGISGPFGYTLDVPPAEWEQVLRVNVLGCYYGCTAVLPHMLERRYGKIINVSGGGASRAQRFLSAYSSSKAAIVRFSEGLAREYNQAFLSINVLEPGLVKTDMITQARAVGSASDALKHLPFLLHAMGTTLEETADLALQMASSATDGVSGKVFQVMPRYRAIWRMIRTTVLDNVRRKKAR